jgi:CheY-like chemotaxis protein
MNSILLVEDNSDLAEYYAERLRAHDFPVAIAADGLDAMRILRHLRPHLVILDLSLPKLNGLDVLKFMRNHPELKHIKVIVLSSHYKSDLWLAAADYGVSAYFLKTACDLQTFIGAVREVLADLHHPPERALEFA